MIEIIVNLHPALVHFPVALISISALFHIAAKLLGRQSRYAINCAVLAHSTLWLAALTALPTVLFGWLASNTVNHDDAGHAAMLLHRSWAIATVLVLAVIAAWDISYHKINTIPSARLVAFVIVASGLVTTTAWHGAELVYRHGLGVMSIPPSGGEGHAHEHADGEGHGNSMPEQKIEPSHEDAHDHDSATSADHLSGEHPHEANPSEQTSAAPQESGHSHAPGIAAHRD